MRIAFIGLGNMGRPMAANLIAASHEVACFDIAVPCPEGGLAAASAAEAASGRDVVFTMLPDGDALRTVAGEIVPAARKGTVLIDCSTVDIRSALHVAAIASESGLSFMDAPVSGGVGGAASGSLTFMAGGTGEAFEIAAPLFEIMGSKAVHCGGAGAGQAAKVCNNMILGATMIVTCEAFALADKLGLERRKLFEVVSESSGYSWSMNAYCPAPGVGPSSPADNGYKPGFAADLMLKDLRLSQLAAKDAQLDTSIGRAATEFYDRFVNELDGSGRDFSAVLDWLAETGGSEPKAPSR